MSHASTMDCLHSGSRILSDYFLTILYIKTTPIFINLFLKIIEKGMSVNISELQQHSGEFHPSQITCSDFGNYYH